MNQELALRVLSRVMGWTDDQAREEFRWLKLMAHLKYDGYRAFQPGMRFTETLATWLQQFKMDDRSAAYAFVRHTLVYIGPTEMAKLVETFYPRFVVNRLIRTAAKELNIPTYHVLVNAQAQDALQRLARQTLVMGLSDGARIDTIRRANSNSLGNEQVVQITQVNPEKWRDLLGNLREDLADRNAGFRLVYLVDDFTATGTSFLRFDNEAGQWKGKLPRFRNSVAGARRELGSDTLFEEGCEFCVHHYVASQRAKAAIDRRLSRLGDTITAGWTGPTRASFGMLLPHDLPIDAVSGRHDAFLRLTRTYYDPSIETKHTAVGGVRHIGLGYGGCALPVVLEHNTPNNSVALLWAETDGAIANGDRAPAMRPLFRRRQRHT